MMSKSINMQELLKVNGAKNKQEIECVLDDNSPSLVEYLLRQSIVTISDLEDNKFDVSWDKIKNSEFKMFEL